MFREGSIKVGEARFSFCIKQYDEGSQFGINGGRISKMQLKRDGEIVANYDRGWDIRPVDEETETALAILLKDYNN